MRWRGRKGSSNVEDRRGGGRLVGGGIGGIVIGLILWLVFGVNPMTAFQTGSSVSGAVSSSGNQGKPLKDNSRDAQFVSVVLADTEAVWGDIFAQSNQRYQQPKLVLYDGQVRSACGAASSAMGPFYCPGDQKLYLDMSFFRDMRRQMGITGDVGSADGENAGKAGDFAQAYVIAHEVGHHVQTLIGMTQKVSQAQARSSKTQANKLSVALELQADCFAGVWANRNQKRVGFLEEGDIEEALHAASQIGDDRLQSRQTGMVVPDNFTHGSSRQRVEWFKRGLTSGNPDACQTF